MKIFNPIYIAYMASGLSISILVIFGLLYMDKSRNQIQYIDAVEHTYKVLSTINFCEKKLIEAEAAQRGYLLTHMVDYRELFEFTLPLVDSSLKVIGEVTNEDIGQKTYFLQLKRFVTTKIMLLKENLDITETDRAYFENLRSGGFIMDNCRFYMAKMRDKGEAALRDAVEKKTKYQQLNLSFFKATFITSCLICIIAIAISFRELGIRMATQRNLKAKINELSKSKKELEEITFVASHDLQEPMRKVRILSNLLNKKLANRVPENDLEIIYRINKITEQMHGLLTDLVSYTYLLNPNEKHSRVDLYAILKDAYNTVFKNGNVHVELSGKLPVLEGSKLQLEIMLVQILDNAVKFKSPDKELLIKINYELKHIKEAKHVREHLSSRQFHQVTITDNGIGFEMQYADKIFGLFQRLHTQSEYPGKGIGLAICRRVMFNHKGFISSNSEKRTGSSFILYFPVTR